MAFLQTLPVDWVTTSAGWGVAKPDPAFFVRVASEVGAAPEHIAYVGDRVDNDVLPARRAGMLAVHLRRGPWGVIHADRPESRSPWRLGHDLDLSHQPSAGSDGRRNTSYCC